LKEAEKKKKVREMWLNMGLGLGGDKKGLLSKRSVATLAGHLASIVRYRYGVAMPK
jgi:hypothetical protein